MNNAPSLLAADWLVRIAAPKWLILADLHEEADGYRHIPTMDAMTAIIPYLEMMLAVSQRATQAWDDGFPASGLVCRDVARAAASTAVAESGWPAVSALSWSHPWDGPVWAMAFAALKATVRQASWIAARAAAAPVAGHAGFDDRLWREAYAAAAAALGPTAQILRASSDPMVARNQSEIRSSPASQTAA